MDLYGLAAADLLDVADSYWHDEIGEMRLLTTLAVTAGAKRQVLPSTREFLAELQAEQELRSAASAHSDAAVRAAHSAEALMGGPA